MSMRKSLDRAISWDLERAARNRSEVLERSVEWAVDMLERGLTYPAGQLPGVVQVVISELKKSLDNGK